MYREKYSKIGHNLKIVFLITVFCLVSTLSKAQVNCVAGYRPDIPLTTATQEQLNEINQIYNKLSDEYLGRTSPGSGSLQYNLNKAKQNYNKLNIRVTNGNISGEISGSSRDPDAMLFAFARYIKFRPTASDIQDIKQKASNVVWLISKKFCEGSVTRSSSYESRHLLRATMFLRDCLSDDIKRMFGNVLYNNNHDRKSIWPTSENTDYKTGDGVNTDDIYNISDSLVAYATWFNNDDEKVRWMKGVTRYLERFMSYSYASADGLKPDGSGFHHWVAYDNYMYAYRTVIKILRSLHLTSFQINRDAYLMFRDALYYQIMIGHDVRIKALSLVGRKPYDRDIYTRRSEIKEMASIGGVILGLTTADPVLAGYYNRIEGIQPEFNYTTITPFEQGYIQFNHAHAGVYRGNNWLVYFKGFSNYMWGAEIYTTENRYGRYQSYGAMEIINPGDLSAENNGFDVGTWNWNFNPGTTTIVLPWRKLKAERRRIDELQRKPFVGSLSLKNIGNPALTKTFGTYGLFAMDFQEKQTGWGTKYGPDTHNNTFTFKKSNFAFSDMIVCLGSSINNNDTRNNTVTTLYQRLSNSRNVTVNGTVVTADSQTFTGNNNWLISNANTGFYVVNGGDIKVWKGTSPTPNHNQLYSVTNFSNNDTKLNTYGYIDHGSNPSDAGYEYICTPQTTVEKMTTLHTKMQSSNNFPYIVHQKNSNAHIVQHKKDKIWAYSFFTTNSDINRTAGIIKSNNKPCLAMYQKTDASSILLSVTNPDLGFKARQTTGTSPTVNIRLTLHGQWLLPSSSTDIKLINSNASETVLEFKLIDGLPVEVQLNSLEIDTDGDGVFDNFDRCNSTPPRESVNEDGCHQSQIDTDGDGVFDINDKCSNTPSNAFIDAVGCIKLSPNNFEIFSTTPKCPNANNGKISIKNISSHMFNFVVTGPNSYNKTFENKLANEPFIIEDLAVGTYNIIAKFSIAGIGKDIIGFQVAVNDATPVSGTNKSVNRLGKSSVFTVSGDKKYSIYVNDVFQRDETFSDESEYDIVVENLSVGKNHIKIIPENICRGLIENWIIIPNGDIKLYPNPTEDLLYIGGLESYDINVQMFTSNGQRVYDKDHKPVNGTVYFSIKDLSAGFYIVRVYGDKIKGNTSFKITKK